MFGITFRSKSKKSLTNIFVYIGIVSNFNYGSRFGFTKHVVLKDKLKTSSHNCNSIDFKDFNNSSLRLYIFHDFLTQQIMG